MNRNGTHKLLQQVFSSLFHSSLACRCYWEWRYTDNPINHVLWMRRVACSELTVTKLHCDFYSSDFLSDLATERDGKKATIVGRASFLLSLVNNQMQKKNVSSQYNFSLELIFLWVSYRESAGTRATLLKHSMCVRERLEAISFHRIA